MAFPGRVILTGTQLSSAVNTRVRLLIPTLAVVALAGPVQVTAAARPAPLERAQAGPCSAADAERAYRESGFARTVDGTLGFSDFVSDRHFCADLTGDGTAELVALYGCCTVSSPRPWAIFRLNADGTYGVAFAAIRVSYVQPLRLRGGTGPFASDVVEKRSILRRSDANCCPSGGFRYRYLRWDGAKFVVAERRTVRRRSRR